MRLNAIFLSALTLPACDSARVTTSKPKGSKDRIVYLDLTRPKEDRCSMPTFPQTLPDTAKTQAHSDASTPNRFIEFANDSTALFNEAALSDITDATPT